MIDSPPSPLLCARQLCFARNDELIFGPVDVQVERGEALLVEGSNGSGKTTLLRVLAGLLTPSEGTVEHDPHAGLSLLGHLLGHKGELSLVENLRFAAGLHGVRPGASIDAVLEEVGLSGFDDQPARTLSAGQRKRLALARLRLTPAMLWLLDEPFANLDLEGIALVNTLIERHLAQGGAALVTSHGAYATGAYKTRVLRLGSER